jgi:hypothetical protein
MNTSTPNSHKTSEWRTNRSTGKAFRPDDRDLVSKRRRRKVSARFRRDWRAWCDRQSDARQKLAVGRKGWRLLRYHGFRTWFYTVSVKELGGAEWLEDCNRYDDPALVEGWIRLLDKAFAGTPYLFALHVGRCDRVHAHVLAGQEHSVPLLSNDPERRKRVDNTPADFRRVLAYLTASQHPTPKQVAAYDRAVKRAGGERFLPKHSGFRNFQAKKPVQRRTEKHVGDGAAVIYPVVMAVETAPAPLSPERFETWLSSAFGTFDRAISPPRKSPYARLETSA